MADSRQAGIATMVLPGVCRSGWQHLLELCTRNSPLLPAIGLHPMYLDHHTQGHLVELAEHINSAPLVALGEIGLDYFITGVSHRKQQELFEAQLALAQKASLPILLHVRKAHDQVLATLRRRHFPHGGIVHAFSGSQQQAEQYIGLGFKISFCGTITYDRARKIRRLAQELKLEDIVVETDAPDMPPASHHGERNVPPNLLEVVRTVAELRGESVEVITRATTANAGAILRL